MAGEHALWEQWAESRDARAFAAIVRALEGFAFDFARRVSGQAADAEDLAQEAFLELAGAPVETPAAVGLRAFLGRRIVLGSKMLRRAALTRARHERGAAERRPAAVEPDRARHEADEALSLLDDDERRAVELRFLHDLSYREIGHVLGVTEVNARVRVHRALGKLRERYGDRTEPMLGALALFLPPRGFAKTTLKTAAAAGGIVLMTTTKKLAIAIALCAGLGTTIAVARHAPDRERTRTDAAPRIAERRAPPEQAESVTSGPGVATPDGRPDPAPPRTIPAGKGSVAGTIRFDDGAPFSNRVVQLQGSPAVTAKTDDEGRFDIHGDWVAQRNLFVTTADGARVVLARIDMRADEVVATALTLARGHTLRGRLRRADDGAPIHGEEIQLRRVGRAPRDVAQGVWATAPTDGEGRFEIPLLPDGEYRAHVQRRGFEPLSVSVLVRDGMGPLDLALKTARALIVRFTDCPEEWRGAVVHLQLHGDDINPVWTDLRIDERGELRIDAPAPGTYRITTIPGGDSPVPTLEATVEITAAAPPLAVFAAAGARLEGTVRLAGGGPAAGISVHLARRGLHTTTDERGVFFFERVAAGRAHLEVRIGRARFPLENVTIPATGTVARHHSFPGRATLRATPRVPGRYFATLRRGADTLAYVGGRDREPLVVPHLAAGDYRLTLEAEGRLPVHREFSIAGDDVDAGEIHAGEPYPRVPVRLTLPAGATVSSFVAAERGEETAHARLHVDSSGNGILTHLAPGRWTVHFDVNGRRRSVEVDVREGAPPVTIDFTR